MTAWDVDEMRERMINDFNEAIKACDYLLTACHRQIQVNNALFGVR